MKLAAIEIVGMLLSFFILAVAFVIPAVLMILCIRALWIYIKTHAKAQEAKKETAAVRRTLSETLKDHRTPPSGRPARATPPCPTWSCWPSSTASR